MTKSWNCKSLKYLFIYEPSTEQSISSGKKYICKIYLLEIPI